MQENMEELELRTDRLLLRQWRPADHEPFFRLNSDPEVMKYFPQVLGKKDSDAMAEKCQSLIALHGWGMWALELLETEQFMGFLGLHKPSAELPFSPCVEIGWRLAKPYWGYGFATEGAKRVLRFAFDELDLEEVVSFTAVINQRSFSVMQRLHMLDTQQNFHHPDLPQGHALSEHVLYKITRQQWERAGRCEEQ